MTCPACGYAWEMGKNACPRCGFRANSPAQSTLTTTESAWRGTASRPGSAGLAPSTGPFSSGESRRSTSAFLSPGRSGARPETSVSGSLLSQSGPDRRTHPLTPGTALQKGRYRLQELLKRQIWGSGAFEATWIGRDYRLEKQVKICEVVLPDEYQAQTLPIMHAATMALLAVRQVPHLTPVLDAFSDQGRSFFVFELPAGETLAAQMRRVRAPLPETTIVNCCLQMTTLLEQFNQELPPLVHGLICPEHISQSYDGANFTLSDFSVLVAGRATPFLLSVDRTYLSPYVAPEFTLDAVQTRNDLYSVLATAYHLATGSTPSGNGNPSARSLNPTLSPAFDALLAKGLHPMPQLRYQQPAQLRQDLLALRTRGTQESSPRNIAPSKLFTASEAMSFSAPLNPASSPLSPLPLPLEPLAVSEDEEVLLPAPETLPPLPMGLERLEAGIILIVILVSLGVITGLSHFHV